MCMGGTPRRMEKFASYIMNEIGHQLPAGTQLADISLPSHRYAMYKVGPVLSVSHGMGMPSVGILLHEIIKLLYYANARDVVVLRLGTCGGIGIEGGNVVLTEQAVDGNLQPFYEQYILGKLHQRPATLDRKLLEEIQQLSRPDDPWRVHVGKTMCTNDFYEGQGRLDGAICEYTEAEKLQFLHDIRDRGVVNMEMESLMFAAICRQAGIRGAVMCVTLLNRLHGDQISQSAETLQQWQEYPQRMAARLIRKRLGLDKPVAP